MRVPVSYMRRYVAGITGPRSLVFSDVITEACGYRLVVAFGLSVSLRVIRGCVLSSDTKDLTYCLPNLGHKLGTVIAEDCVRHAVRDDPMIEHHGCDIRSGNLYIGNVRVSFLYLSAITMMK